MGKRRFGRVRQLPSGRWQARYQGPDGVDRPAPETFGNKTAAERWLSLKEAEIVRGEWINPDDGKVSLADYAEMWIDERTELRPKTLTLNAEVIACGYAPVFEVAPGTATAIATGGVIPRGADAVVMIEHTELGKGNPPRIEVTRHEQIEIAER